ncbi:hypothetical protein A2U01_0073438, partial [Trifolium medium]|nr:hypothetical protein [Trifolium medium]
MILDDFSETENVITKLPAEAATSGSQHGGFARKTVSSDSILVRRKCHLSCPPDGERSIVSGPW